MKYTAIELADKLGLARSTVRSYAARYNLGVLVGKKRMFSQKDHDYLKNMPDRRCGPWHRIRG